ncbi:hypothetical protein PVAND_013185 [Polypedilum vanderplanki]|nr:hypothetical protein PVAND_013185 [Polypedilum vanderplanki]
MKISGKKVDGRTHLLWCINCDELDHLACLALTAELTDKDAPYVCSACVKNPTRQQALEAAQNGTATKSFAGRLQSIKAPRREKNVDKELLDFFDSLRIEVKDGQLNLHQLKERFDAQRSETDSLGIKLLEAKEHIAELNAEIDKQNEELSSLRMDATKLSSTRYHTHDAEKLRGMTYAQDFDVEFPSSRRSSKFFPSRSFASHTDALEKTLEVAGKLELNQLRHVLPVIKEFNGDPNKWLAFERQVKLVQTEGAYNSQHMKHIVRDKLTGAAADLAERLFETHEWNQIMDHLRSAFGDPRIVVEAKRKQVQGIRLPRDLTHASVIEVTTLISGYLQACKQARLNPHDRTLALLIYSQLDIRYREEYFRYFKQHFPTDTREERLDILVDFLDSIRDTLPIGTFKETKSHASSYQVTNISSNNNAQKAQQRDSSRPSYPRSRSDAYEIRDIKDARYQGYNMEKLKTYPSHCYLCTQNGHYTVECKNYKKKSAEDRQKFVDSKMLCHLCIVATDHNASQCPLRRSCGARVASTRCTGQHHVSLHNRNNSKIGQRRSSRNAYSKPQDDKPSTNYQGFPVPNNKGASNIIFKNSKPASSLLLTASSQSTSRVESSPRTIKLFRTFVEYEGRRAAVFAVGDSAAEISLVKRSLVNELGITGPPAVISISWTDDSSKNLTGIKVDLPVRGTLHNSKEFIIKGCFAIDDFQLPPRSLNVEQIKRENPYLQSIPFDSYANAVPAILLGSSHASLFEALKLWENGNGKPVGVLTKLGYTIYGCNTSEDNHHDILNAIASESSEHPDDSSQVTNEDLSKQLEFYNSLDSFYLKPATEQLTADEKSALRQAENGLVQLPSGFVQMPLIWRKVEGEKPKLLDNFPLVLRRQLAQERKLLKNPELLKAFNDNFKAEIDDGYVRPATEQDMRFKGNVNYVPMSLVVNHNKRPIKTRNVYDASAKYKGTSLNDKLLPGPNLLIDLLKPIMSMRENSIAFTGDIKSMFNRIVIDPDDQNSQRILWRENQDQPMQIFIKKTMLFGPTSSPFVSQFAKNWLASQFKQKFPTTAHSITTEVYMDDWFTSVPTLAEAIQRAHEGIAVFASARMQLVGFQSNSAAFLATLPESRIKKELIPFTSEQHVEYISKVLGISWNTVNDTIVFELNESLLKDKYKLTGIKPTKREQCSLIARIFDVLGLIAHCVVRARILLQHSFKKNIDWDQEIADEDAILWSEWLTDLKKASSVQIPRRRTTLDSLASADSIELHTFTDAGQEAIAAIAYFVVIHKNRRESSFVLAKAKVAPLKLKNKQEVTEMPRLELLGALVGARLAAHVVKLHPHLKLKQFFWCDSEVVLRWIWNTNMKLPRFAISPIGEILETTEISQWRYVESRYNVADLATKFQQHEFGNPHSVWFTGPEFIKLEPDHWPTQSFTKTEKEKAIICAHQLVELDKANRFNENPMELIPKQLPPYDCALMALRNKETGEILSSAIMNQLIIRKPSIYFTWSKLVRATARAILVRDHFLIPLLKSGKWRNRTTRRKIFADANFKDSLSPQLINKAELFLVRYMQRQKWQTEIDAISKGHRINNRELLQANVFIDQDGILRIRSRVSLPLEEYPQKYAPIIPRLDGEHSLSDILLFHYHNKYRHVCVEAQMAEFRSKYWMNALRERLKLLAGRCNLCRLERSKHKTPIMADLPIYRVDRKLNPFEVAGLDCCGPFKVTICKKESDKTRKCRNMKHVPECLQQKDRKVWILLFTCAVTRFIHLELLESMDTQTILAAISSAYAAHGPIIRLVSDNGTNFIGANNVLCREYEKQRDEIYRARKTINDHFIAQLKEFRWEFIPVKASWMGGFYERLIGELKRGMKAEISAKGIDLRAFKIAMYETAHRLNCRPLTHLPVSHEEDELLTPHHLAKNRSGWPMLPSAHNLKESNIAIDERSYYVEGQKLADKITRSFYAKYLPELTLRQKWNRKEPPLKVGDLVLVIDPNQSRSQWSRGIVHALRPSGDGIPRSAEIRFADGVKTRAVQHLVKIEIAKA